MIRFARTNYGLVGLSCLLMLTGCSNETSTDGGGGKPAANDSGGGNADSGGSGAGGNAEPIAAKDFPVPEGTNVFMKQADPATIMMRGPNDMDAQSKFFDLKLSEMGWKKSDSSEVIDGVGFFDYSKGNLTLTLYLNPDRDGETMTITASGDALSVPEDTLDVPEAEVPDTNDESGSIE